ncbi:MAG: nuclear transport factor 2 family protein [Ilumatobacteraceae bacterium]
MQATFAETWLPLQPTADERRLDPAIIAASGETVVARYTWRGRDAHGRTFAADTIAHYEVRDGLFAKARMYHFDLTGLIAFLDGAAIQSGRAPQAEAAIGHG